MKLEDLIKIEKRKINDSEIWECKLDLQSIVFPLYPEEIPEEALQQMRENLKYTFIREMSKLCFEFLKRKYCVNYSHKGLKIVVSLHVPEDVIIVHPKSFSILLKEWERNKNRNKTIKLNNDVKQ